MFSKYFYPYCVKPIYFLDNEKEAVNCALINGIINVIIIFFFIIVALYRFYNNTKIRKIVIALLFFALFIAYPILLFYGKKIEWNGYKNAYKRLIDDGYSKKDAMYMLQGFNLNVATSPTSIGSTVASALFLSKGQPRIQDKDELNDINNEYKY